MNLIRLFLFFAFLICTSGLCAQDSVIARERLPSTVVIDTIRKTKHSPRKAAIRSAIIPGWGQIYNRKYWKVPIVYTAIGIPIGTFIYNKKWYEETSTAAQMLGAEPPDTANYQNRVDEKLHVFFTTPNSLGALLNYRNEFRKNMDYSILFVLLFWGLNIVDATVDAHLREFDISDDLGLQIKPTWIPISNTPGITFVLRIGK